MKRAKLPPPLQLVAECGVIADMLELGRRVEITSCPSLGINSSAHTKLGAIAHETPDPEETLRLLDSTGKTADLILGELVHRAMQEYLRRFPKVHKPNNDPWHAEPQMETQTRDLGMNANTGGSGYPKGGVHASVKRVTQTIRVSTGELDYQCFFCRKSLHTRLQKKRLAKLPREQMIAHAEKCAVMMLAELLEPHPPLPKGEPGL